MLKSKRFPHTCPLADNDSCWTTTFNDRVLINVTACYESTVLFAAREGWINTIAPFCMKETCLGLSNSSYCTKLNNSSRMNGKSWVWRFRCCRARQTILKDSMFCNGKLQPGSILEIMWKISSCTPSAMIPRLIYGRQTSEVYNRIQFMKML